MIVLFALALQGTPQLPQAHDRLKDGSATVQAVYDARAEQTTVQLQRSEADVVIDGKLDEPVWQRAALLTGFWQNKPVEARPAKDSTQVLVWYSPSAIYFGIRAFAPADETRAKLADRDKIDSDDFVQIILDTFNDRRQALVFGVNPLGVQGDGVRVEGGGGTSAQAGGSGGGASNFNSVDLTPDFVYQSKGHLTADGYEVEVRIPFKSLRYQSTSVQDWGINIYRKTQYSGFEDTWTKTQRIASFLAQSGTIKGLHDLKRGLVLDLNPVATTRIDGLPATSSAPSAAWKYSTDPEFGGNVRWGVTPNLTLNGTINPDFSQVEADVGQVASDVRFAVSFPEKRPFFVEGSEQFSTPNNLVYTRTVVNPIGAIKLTGKVAGTTVGVLTALDDKILSVDGSNNPLFGIARIRRDLGRSSTAGVTLTNRSDGGAYNRIADMDFRFVFRRLYYVQLQYAQSFTQSASGSLRGPLFEAVYDRTGRNFGFHYGVLGIAPGFRAATGFVSRTGFVRPQFNNRFTYYGKRGDLIEAWTVMPTWNATWDYNRISAHTGPMEWRTSGSNSINLRGGWAIGVAPLYEMYHFDQRFHAGQYVHARNALGADTIVPYFVEGNAPTRAVSTGVSTPQFSNFSAQLSVTIGTNADFLEHAPSGIMSVSSTVNWRPTQKLRVQGIYTHQQFNRDRDGTLLTRARIPRLKGEYQLSRAIFLRLVGQYDAREWSALRDPRTDLPILLFDPNRHTYVPIAGYRSNAVRVDWLFSYQPRPGTVVFAGYGSTLTEDDAFNFNNVRRVNDGFFFKVSYLFRM
jgi:hypothetical protein